jgi:MFS family permease
VAYGWLADRQWVSSQTLVNASLLMVAVANCALAATVAYVCAFVYALVFGFIVGRIIDKILHAHCRTASFLSLTSVVLVEQVGIGRLTNAYGLLCVFRGVALIFGSPIAGRTLVGVCACTHRHVLRPDWLL